MEIRKKRKFEIGFKRQVVSEVETGKLSLSAAARKYEISPTAITYWREKLREGKLTDSPSKRERELEKELESYKVLLAEKYAEIEFLKKLKALEARKRRLDSSAISGLNLSQFAEDAK
jgi:transposase-like protein